MAELEDTLRETGVSAVGSTSPSKVQPQDIDRAFSAADRVDPGSSMPEAGLVPFHNKVATMGMRGAMLTGAGLGALTGGATAYAGAPEGHKLRNTLIGAGIGGAAGAALTPAVYKHTKWQPGETIRVAPFGGDPVDAGAAAGLLAGTGVATGAYALASPEQKQQWQQQQQAQRSGMSMRTKFATAETRLERAERRPWWLRSRADRQWLLHARIDKALFDEGKTAALRDLGLLKLAEGMAGSAPIPSATSVKPPKSSTKISPTYDTRTDKPPGYNLTHGVQTMSNGADVNDSYGAFGRRLQGSPV